MAINMEWVLREKEDIRKALIEELKAIDKQVEVFPIVAEAIKAQDGKVYNKRVDEAVRNCLGTREEKEAGGKYKGVWVYLTGGYGTNALKVCISTAFSRAAYYSEVTPSAEHVMITAAGKATRFCAEPLLKEMEATVKRMGKSREEYAYELEHLDELVDLYVETYNKVLHFQERTTSTFRDHLTIKHVY